MKNHPATNGLRTWIEVDTMALAHNYKILRGLLSPKTKFMAVVKSNAYGHSLVDFSREVEKLGADWIGVDSIVEAEALREAGIEVPILVLGYTLPEKIAEAAAGNISLTVSTFETLEHVAKVSGKLTIHIKVDTGMHRQGFQIHEMAQVMEKLKNLPKNIIVEGLFTHFAAAKNPSFPQKTLAQIAELEKWRTAFTDAGLSPIVHAAASPGALVFPQSHYDLVRFGVAMYGIWPSAQIKGYAEEKIKLQPVLSWKVVIGEVKEVKKGEQVGYDFTETLKRDSKLAICPIGYWHGFPRLVSSIAHVLVNGKRARVVGRVSMDMITIDVTDIPDIQVGSIATIIGRDGAEEVPAEQLADLTETSAYEIITRLNPLIKRVFI